MFESQWISNVDANHLVQSMSVERAERCPRATAFRAREMRLHLGLAASNTLTITHYDGGTDTLFNMNA